MIAVDPSIAVFVLVSLSTAGLLGAVVLPAIEGARHRRRRIASVVGAQGLRPTGTGRTRSSEAQRRREIEDVLREMRARREQKAGENRRPGLKRRLREAGLTATPRDYWILSAASVFVFTLAILVIAGMTPGAAAGFGTALGLYVPHAGLSLMRARRLARFATDFPDALDVMVRGVRAGRPLGDCLAIVASDSNEPIRSEFRRAIEDATLGLGIDEVTERIADRVPLPEVNFLAIVVTIQARSGGSLTEALSNLSQVLRGRKQLRAKVKAMSAEAKASAGIIGSLPVAVALLMQLTSPDYIGLLYSTTLGQIVLAACGAWMGIGVLVMRQMINFDM